MNLRQNLKHRAPVIFVSLMLTVLLFVWYFMFRPTAWEETPNYPHMYFQFVVSRPVEAFLTVNTGPGYIVAWVFIPIYLGVVIHAILYIVEKRREQHYTILNRYYLVYLAILALFAISFQNASQHYDWYWNPELNAPGYVDTWTHITSPWLMGALVAPLALERYLGWKKKYSWFFIFAILATIALVWEIAETSDVYTNPSPSYFNYPTDSVKDIIMGAGIGTILSSFMYERLVSDLAEETGTSV